LDNSGRILFEGTAYFSMGRKNAASVANNKVLAVQYASLGDGAQIQQYDDTGTPDHMWRLQGQGVNPQGIGTYIIQNVLSDLVSGIDQMSTSPGSLIKQPQNNGTADHLWIFDTSSSGCPATQSPYGLGSFQSTYDSLYLTPQGDQSADSVNIIQDSFHGNGGAADSSQCWALTPKNDPRMQAVHRIRNVNSNLFIGPLNGSGDPDVQVVQYADNGSISGLDWQVQDQGNGTFVIRNLEMNRVLGVEGESTADSAPVRQGQDTLTPDQFWQFIDQGNGQYKIKNMNSGLLLGVDQESTSSGANIVQFEDSGTPDHLWYVDAVGWPAKFPQ
jgi:hypothetical protein